MIAITIPPELGPPAMFTAPVTGLPSATKFALPMQPSLPMPVEAVPKPGGMLPDEVAEKVVETPGAAQIKPSSMELAAEMRTIRAFAKAEPKVSIISVDGAAVAKSHRAARPAVATDKQGVFDPAVSVVVVPVTPPLPPAQIKATAHHMAAGPAKTVAADRDLLPLISVMASSPETGHIADIVRHSERPTTEAAPHAGGVAQFPPDPVHPEVVRIIANLAAALPPPPAQPIVVQQHWSDTPLLAPVPQIEEPPAASSLPTIVRATATIPPRSYAVDASAFQLAPGVGSRQRDDAVGLMVPPPLRDSLQLLPPAPLPATSYRPEPSANSAPRATETTAPSTPSASVAVDTPSLGAVAAQVTHHDRHNGEMLHVHFAVDRSGTAALITGASDDLGRALAATGSRLDALTVEVRGGATAALSHRTDPGGGDAGRSGDDARRQAPVPRQAVPPALRPTPTKPVERDRFA